jgi:phosphate-selective porin OprO/OprP
MYEMPISSGWFKPLLVLTALFSLALGQAVLVQAQEEKKGPELHGRAHIDYAYHQNDVTEFGDGARLRRARLAAEGKYDAHWSYEAWVDLAENEVEWKDLFIRYTFEEGAGQIQQGQFKIPFGMEELTSSNNITFIERPLPITTFADWNDTRRLGLAYMRPSSNSDLRVMLFGQPIGTNADRQPTTEVDEETGEETEIPGGKEGMGLGVRYAMAFAKSESGLIHLGVAYTTEGPPSDQDKTARLRTRPESRASGVRLVDTGTIEEVDSVNNLGVELAWQGGPLIVQGEYITTAVAAAEDFAFSGYYVHASYLVTGEMKGYRNGVFSSPSVGDTTAIEVAARISNVNLDDGDIEGGEETNTTLGVNFYPIKNVRFMLNYIMVQSTKGDVDDNPSIILFRTQFAW